MLKNCVLRVSVDTQKWAKAAGIRAVKTMAQAAIAGIGAAALNISHILSASALAGVLSMLMSITGIPEVESEE